jgi:hypothetical protein
MSSDLWYIRHHDKVEHGPYSLDVLVKAATEGSIATDTEVMHGKHTGGRWILAMRIRPIASVMPLNDSSTAPPPLQPEGNPQPDNSPTSIQPQSDQTSVPAVAPVAVADHSTRRHRKRPPLTVPKSLSAALLALFDFRFQYFITPWIIKIYWAFAVIMIGTGLVFSIGSYAISPIVSAVSNDTESSDQYNYNSGSSRNSSPIKMPKFVRSISAASIGVVVTLIAAVTFLLFLRVFLELAIVAFRIAEDMSDVRRMASEVIAKNVD